MHRVVGLVAEGDRLREAHERHGGAGHGLVGPRVGQGEARSDDDVGAVLLDSADHRLDVGGADGRSEEHTSELQSRGQLVCRLLLEKKNNTNSIAAFWYMRT